MGTTPPLYYGKVHSTGGTFTVIRVGRDAYRWGPITANSPAVTGDQLMMVFDAPSVPDLSETTHEEIWGYRG